MKLLKRKTFKKQLVKANKEIDNIKKAIIIASKDVKGRARHLLAQQVRFAKNKSHDAKANVAYYAKQKPFRAMGFAAIAGVCLGMLMRNK